VPWLQGSGVGLEPKPRALAYLDVSSGLLHQIGVAIMSGMAPETAANAPATVSQCRSVQVDCAITVSFSLCRCPGVCRQQAEDGAELQRQAVCRAA
jgi:hypothetical protein